MARLLTSGFESRLFTTALATNGEGQETLTAGTPTIVTEAPKVWSGSCALKCAKGVNQEFDYRGAMATERTYSWQMVLLMDALPSAGTNSSENNFCAVRNAGGTIYEPGVHSNGEVFIWISTAAEEKLTGIKVEANKHYIFEFQWKIPTAGKGKIVMRVRNEKGELVGEYETGEVGLGTTAPTQVNVGHLNVAQADVNYYFSQVILNDSVGTNEVLWVGYQKVVLIKARADESRAGYKTGAGGETELFKAVKNFPPTGVANGAKTATSQDYSANNNSTDYYEADVNNWSTPVAEGGGGITASDVFKVAMWIARGSGSSVTTRNWGIQGTWNPYSPEVLKATGGTAAGTEPVGWGTQTCAPIYPATFKKNSPGTEGESPALEAGGNPRFRKATTTTDAIAIDMVGLYVSYEPASAAGVTIPLNAAAGAAATSLAITAKTTIVLNSAAGSASPTLALTAKTQIALNPAAGSSSTSAALGAKTLIALNSAAGSSSTSLALTAAAQVPLNAAAGSASTSLALTARTNVPLSPAAGAASTSLALKVPVKVPLTPAAGSASTALTITAPVQVKLQSAAGSASTSLAVRVPVVVPLSPAAGSSSTSLRMTVKFAKGLYVKMAGVWIDLTGS